VTRRPARAVAAALAATCVVALPGCGDEPSSDPPAVGAPASPKSRVIVVVMENKERDQVIGDPEAPYVTELARRYAAPLRMYGITHPSMPNYLALIAGSTFGLETNCTDCIQIGRTLVDQFEEAGISWRGYMEAMPGRCFTGAAAGRYVKRHNPFVYFRSIIDRPERCRNVVPASQLAEDQRVGRLPDYVFITPDLCNDTHDCSVAHGDRYLSRLIPPLLGQLGPHGFLVLTYDEGTSDSGCCGGLADGGLIPTVIAGPDVRRGAEPAEPYTLYSVLRTIEDAYGLEHLRKAGIPETLPLDAMFERPPRLR
jgi:phosphatidylinositol-3-phosphatase